MRDIVVTTPKSQMETAAREAEQCIRAIRKGDPAHYFRTFRKRPKDLKVGSRIFYVEDGYVRGFAKVCEIVEGGQTCETTGKKYNGFHAVMDAKSWKWIKPIPMKGFQGWRYFDPPKSLKIVGNYLKPKPT